MGRTKATAAFCVLNKTAAVVDLFAASLYMDDNYATGSVTTIQTNKNLYSAKFVDKTRQRRWVVS